MGIEPTSSAWKADILADVLYPHLQGIFYHTFPECPALIFKIGRSAGGTRSLRCRWCTLHLTPLALVPLVWYNGYSIWIGG